MASEITPQQLLEQAQLVHSAEAVNSAITKLSHEISSQLASTNPIVICVMNGGLMFAGSLLTQLKFPLQVDYVHASRYQNAQVGHDLQWHAKFHTDLNNRTVLLLDDILDEGITLHNICQECQSLSPKALYTAVLVEKKIARKIPFEADFVGLEVPNRYVFGFGMDIHGYWRNLPAIYAL